MSEPLKIDKSAISFGRTFELLKKRTIKELNVDVDSQRATNIKLENEVSTRLYSYLKSLLLDNCVVEQPKYKRRKSDSDLSDYDPDDDRPPTGRKISREKQENIINYIKKHPRVSSKTIGRSYGLEGKVSDGYIRQLRKRALCDNISKEIRQSKYQQLREALYRKYEEVMKSNEEIEIGHKEIREWAFKLAEELEITDNFACSDTYIRKWKLRFGLNKAKLSKITRREAQEFE